jgi:hypothetical protein
MPGLVPGIHVFRASARKDVDGRDKPGHDEKSDSFSKRHRSPQLLFALSVKLSTAGVIMIPPAA